MTVVDRLTRRQFLAGSAVGVASLANITWAAPAASAPAPADKPVWKIGCYTRPWAQHPYPVALDAIAEAGFKYVGLMTNKDGLIISTQTTPQEAESVGEAVRKRGLQASSVYGGGIPVRESLQAAVTAMRQLIDNCAAAQAQSLLMGGIGEEKYFDAYYQAIAECCDYAAEKKVRITIKPHGGLNSTGAQCRKCVERVNHRNFTMWYDPGNIFYYSEGKLNPVDDAATVDGIVTGMCVKDYQHPKKVDVTPGTGQVKFKAVLRQLRNGGFQSGPLIVECLTPRDTLADTLEEARKAKTFLERITAEL